MRPITTLNPIVIGDDLQYLFVVTDAATGDPVDLTGETFEMFLKENRDDDDNLAVLHVSEVVPSSESAESGRFLLRVPSDDTDDLEARTYAFKFVRTSGSFKQTLGYGNVSAIKL